LCKATFFAIIRFTFQEAGRLLRQSASWRRRGGKSRQRRARYPA